jgi:hypothetical protein
MNCWSRRLIMKEPIQAEPVLKNIPFSEFEQLRNEGKALPTEPTKAPAVDPDEPGDEEELETEVDETEEEESEASEEEEETEDDDQDPEEKNGQEKPKKKGGFQKKIEKLDVRARTAEQERDYWRQKALNGKDAADPDPDKKSEKKETTSKPKPKAEDFETVGEFIEALTDWKTEQATAKTADKLKAERDAADQATKAQSEKQQLESNWKKQEAAAKAKHEDYEEVTSNPDAPCTQTMAQRLLKSEVGGELAYYLGKNLKEAKRIAALEPADQIYELGKIEAKIAPPKSVAKNDPTEKAPTTKAPKPLTPVKKASGKNVERDWKTDPKTSYEDFEKKRNEELYKKS